MTKPCEHCNAHIKVHGAVQFAPGQPITSVNDGDHHKHGQRTCDECDQPFSVVHHSFGDPDPNSPSEPIPLHPGHLAVVHKRCRQTFEAKRAAGVE
jgi:hypothetical protein